jgi:hypothetical protein
MSGMLKDYYNGRVENVSLYDITSWCQFHQRFTHPFFVRMSFLCLEFGFERTFVCKICAKNVDEIDHRASSDSIWDLTIPLFSQYMMGCKLNVYTNLLMNLTEFGTNLCLKKKILEESSDNKTLLCCFNMAQTLVQENYETFIEIIKHSQAGNTTPTIQERSEFQQKYVNSSRFMRQLNTISPYLQDQIVIIPFCETVSRIKLHGISSKFPLVCSSFYPVVTSKGLCYSFNSLAMNKIFKPLVIPWASILNAKNQTSEMVHPLGIGPNNGLNFVLNAFESFSAARSTKNFILSITNENNPFDILKQNYIIEPGNAYTYRVIANQIGTTDRFNAMDPVDRGCSLPHEIGLLVKIVI